MSNPELQLKRLGLTESEITVYLRMSVGALNARDLMKTTKMKRPTIYYALNSLEKRGLVHKSGKENDATFVLAPYERLIAIAKEKEDEAMTLTESIGELIPTLAKSKNSKMEKPQVSFYEGLDAVKHVVMDAMYTKNKHIDIIAPQYNFFWGVGEEFLIKYISERRQRNITTRNMWEAEVVRDDFEDYYGTMSEIKILPEVMKGKFKTTIFLFDDKTLYVSSYENPYAILVTSLEHNETMSALFDGLWITAKNHKK